MTPLPVIADVYRCAIKWSSSAPADPIPVNVFHVLSPDSSDVSEIAAAIGGALTDAPGGDMFAGIHTNYDFQDLDITPLDGVTAQQEVTVGHLTGGSSTGNIIPNQAAVVSFHTTQRGPRGRGRMYVGPIGEGQVDEGVVGTATLGAMVSGWNAFLEALPLQTPGLALVIASYVHADAHLVTTLTVDRIVGTQRRRLDQLR